MNPDWTVLLGLILLGKTYTDHKLSCIHNGTDYLNNNMDIWTRVLIMHASLLRIMLGFIHFPKLKKNKKKKNRGRAQRSEDWEILGWMTYKTLLITICGSVGEEDQELQKWSSTSFPSCYWSWPRGRSAYRIVTGRFDIVRREMLHIRFQLTVTVYWMRQNTADFYQLDG